MPKKQINVKKVVLLNIFVETVIHFLMIVLNLAFI